MLLPAGRKSRRIRPSSRPPADRTSISGGLSSSITAANVEVDADAFPEVGEVLGDFSLLSAPGMRRPRPGLPGDPAVPGRPAGRPEGHAPPGPGAPVAGPPAAHPHHAALCGAGPRRSGLAGALHALSRGHHAGAAAPGGGRYAPARAAREASARRAARPGPGQGADGHGRAGARLARSSPGPLTSRRCAGSGPAWPTPCITPTSAGWSTWT